jgi:hypothetical protein
MSTQTVSQEHLLNELKLNQRAAERMLWVALNSAHERRLLAGRQLGWWTENGQVQVAVAGHALARVWSPATDWADAMLLFKRLSDVGYQLDIRGDRELWQMWQRIGGGGVVTLTTPSWQFLLSGPPQPSTVTAGCLKAAHPQNGRRRRASG